MTTTLSNGLENQENITVIWFDSNNELNDNKENVQVRLYEITNNVIFHTEFESCITDIQINENEKIILIISGLSNSQILSSIQIFDQIECIFIFYWKKDQYEHILFENSSNIIDIYDDFELLYLSIKEQIDFINEEYPQWCFFDQNEYENKDLSKQSNDFLWFQLFP